MAFSDENLLKHLWRAWLKFGRWLGNVMNWIWLPLFYFTILMPVALVMKLFADPLRLRGAPAKSHWTPKELPLLDMQWAKNQGSVPPDKKCVRHPAHHALH